MAEQVNTDELTLEQLKELANKEAAGGAVEAPEKAVPEPEPPEETEPEEPAETIYERRIDLGDGSGVQVFRGHSLDELVDKLATAQENATRKIRELSKQAKKEEPKPEAVKELTADQEFLLAQEFMSNPSKALGKAFREAYGYDPADFRKVQARLAEYDAERAQQNEAKKQDEAVALFLSGHPEYLPNPKNGARFQKAVSMLIFDEQRAGRQPDYASLLETAYKDLSESGLLEVKPEEPRDEPKPEARAERIAEPEPRAPKKASGLSGRSGTPAPKAQGPTEEELYAMPLEKLRELADQAGRQH